MTDELTPQEKEALNRLPRERMPGGGLEERVVAAMHESGFLAKRRRMVAITGGRVAALVAASVALVIGAYSIGLQRGGGVEIPPAMEMVKPDDSGRVPQAAPVQDEARKDEAAQAEGVLESSERGVSEPAPAAPMESKADRVAQNEPAKKSATHESGLAASAPEEARAPGAGLDEAAPAAPAARTMITPGFTQFPLELVFNGIPVIIEAPEGVRVAQDDQGRTLIIYASDAVIRIRPASGR